MGGYPDQLTAKRHRDLEGRSHDPWIRRVFLTLLTAIAVAALFNVFGQRAQTSSADAAQATLKVSGPKRVRGGLLYQQQITVTAHQDVAHPRLVLSSGWLDGQTINTIEPAAVGESSRDGKLVLSYDELSAGDKLVVYVDFQVNPTHIGKTDHDVELDDAETPLVHVDGSLLTLP